MKQEDSREIRVVLSRFSLELEISGVAIQRAYIKRAENKNFCEELLNKNYFEAFVMNMVSWLLRQFRRSLQIKKNIAIAPCVLQFAE